MNDLQSTRTIEDVETWLHQEIEGEVKFVDAHGGVSVAGAVQEALARVYEIAHQNAVQCVLHHYSDFEKVLSETYKASTEKDWENHCERRMHGITKL